MVWFLFVNSKEGMGEEGIRKKGKEDERDERGERGERKEGRIIIIFQTPQQKMFCLLLEM